jgi:hypothetical protein
MPAGGHFLSMARRILGTVEGADHAWISTGRTPGHSRLFRGSVLRYHLFRACSRSQPRSGVNLLPDGAPCSHDGRRVTH